MMISVLGYEAFHLTSLSIPWLTMENEMNTPAVPIYGRCPKLTKH